MKIILVRHGESEGNVKNEINDDPNRIVNLTARGRQQAEAAAERLRGVPLHPRLCFAISARAADHRHPAAPPWAGVAQSMRA